LRAEEAIDKLAAMFDIVRIGSNKASGSGRIIHLFPLHCRIFRPTSR